MNIHLKKKNNNNNPIDECSLYLKQETRELKNKKLYSLIPTRTD